MLRNPAIDTLRGVSILLVVLHHLGLRVALRKTFLAPYLGRAVCTALNYTGYEAVFIFFVISGFLIALHSLERWGDLGRVKARAFYARRFARIVPCFALLLGVLCLLHALGAKDYVVHEHGETLGRALLSAIGLHLNWYEGHYGYLPAAWDVLWSLSIEEVFYLGFPLVCLLLRREWLLALGLAALAISLPWTRAALEANEVWQEKAYLPGMAAIAVGVLAALAVKRGGGRGRGVAWVAWGVGVLGVAMVLLEENVLWPVLKQGTVLMLTFSAALFCYGAQVLRADGKGAWASGWVRAWGRRSYEIYLTHCFVLFALLGWWRAHDGNLWRGAWLYLPLLVLTFALGWVVERWVSQPSERWLRARLLATAEARQ